MVSSDELYEAHLEDSVRIGELEEEVERLKLELEKPRETEKQTQLRRQRQRALTSWQHHAARMGKILGCFGVQDEIEESAKRLVEKVKELEREITSMYEDAAGASL